MTYFGRLNAQQHIAHSRVEKLHISLLFDCAKDDKELSRRQVLRWCPFPTEGFEEFERLMPESHNTHQGVQLKRATLLGRRQIAELLEQLPPRNELKLVEGQLEIKDLFHIRISDSCSDNSMPQKITESIDLFSELQIRQFDT